nr:MAG TPA: hypothetical protein [Microviridae sp.]
MEVSASDCSFCTHCTCNRFRCFLNLILCLIRSYFC